MHPDVEAALALLVPEGCPLCRRALKVEGEIPVCPQCGVRCPFCGKNGAFECAHRALNVEPEGRFWAAEGLEASLPRPPWPFDDRSAPDPGADLSAALAGDEKLGGLPWSPTLREWSCAIAALWQSEGRAVALGRPEEARFAVYASDAAAFVRTARSFSDRLRKRIDTTPPPSCAALERTLEKTDVLVRQGFGAPTDRS